MSTPCLALSASAGSLMSDYMKVLLVISKLVKMSVFGTREDIPAGVNWTKVFTDAGVNGVSALCYEAVKTLPQDKQPDFDLMLRWDLSVQGLREGFRRRHEATQQLRTLMESKNLQMLLLKGESLAANYPDPELRESGDVDFVALANDERAGAFDECNDLALGLGIDVNFESQRKHSSFIYDGVHFENHNLENTKGYNRVHHRTFALVKESLPDAVRRPDGCLELDSVTAAVFVVKHTAQHLCYSGGRIALRMLLDLALLLKAHPGITDEWEPALKKAGLEKFADVMLCATDLLLGTAFRTDWSEGARRRTWRFIRLSLTDSPRATRYFAKFFYLPLRPSEVMTLWLKKAGKMLGMRMRY